MDILTDNAIMLQVKDGNLDRMGILFRRYQHALYGFLFRMSGRREASEDMVQNVFYRLIRSRHTFTGNGPFKTWMYHVARNVLKDYLKKNALNGYYKEIGDREERIGGGSPADERLSKKQELVALQKAISCLSEDYREVIILSRFQDLKYQEIASILDISESLVKVRAHRAMQQLKNTYLKSEKHEM